MKNINIFFVALAMSFFFAGSMYGQCPAGQDEITIDILTDSFGGETTWEIYDECGGAVIAAGGPYASNSPITESVCVNPGPYTFTIFDQFGDGMCCAFGAGSYSVSYNGTVEGTGGMYGSSESTALNSTASCSSCAGDEVVINILTDSFGSETAWTLEDVNSGTVWASSPFFTYGNAETISETFCVDPPGCLEFTIEDLFGDGMCCAFGTGSYEVIYNGTVVASGGMFGASESTRFGVDCPTPPANDLCDDALPLNCGETLSGTTIDATFDGAPFCGTANTSPGVWYEISPPAGSIVTLSTCNQATFDTKISVYTGGCAALTCVAGQDDNTLECGFDFTTKLTFCADGSTYLVLVHGFGDATGDFDLSATCDAPVANDFSCAAEFVEIGTTTPFSNFCATVQPGEPAPGAGTGTSSCTSQDGWCSFETDIQNTVWFSFLAPASGCVSILADGFDTQLAIYSAELCFDVGSYSLIAANDDSGVELGGTNAFAAGLVETACLNPGELYWIQVDGFSGTFGNGDLIITDCGNDILTVDAGDCQTRFLGYGPAEEDTLVLCAEVTGGFPPYTYAWSPAGIFSNGNCTAVQPDSTTTYTVTITDAKGCSVTDEVLVQVIDVEAPCDKGNGKKDHKVLVCHHPPGNPTNVQEICIDRNGVPAHIDPTLGHASGCHLGPCDNPCLASNPAIEPCFDLTLNLVTDNFATETSWVLEDLTDGVILDSRAGGSLLNATTYTETYCVDRDHCFEFRIEDSLGDGICCSFGIGSYSLSLDGATVVSPTAGSFGSSEAVQIGGCTSAKAATVQTEEATQAQSALFVKELEVEAFPNPFTTISSIKFHVPTSSFATVEVFSATGVKVGELFNGQVEAGQAYLVEFDAHNMPNGVYFYTVKTAEGDAIHGKLIHRK